MKTLIIMRHAHAESTAPTDAERSLTAAGARAALAAANWLAEHSYQVDCALVSAATRTMQTAQLLGLSAALESIDDMYCASASVLEHVVREHAHGSVVLVLAHNPGVSYLCPNLPHGLAPAEIAVAAFAGEWSGFSAAKLTLVEMSEG